MKRCATLLVFLFLLIAAPTAFARGGGGCFESGTPVLTPGGPVAIEQLAPGDAIWTVTDGRLAATKVLSCYRVEPQEYVSISWPGGQVRVTSEHPIAVGPGEFRSAGLLCPGDTVLLWTDSALTPVRLLAVAREPADRPAYNLLVAANGTYLADGLLVHNKGCFLPDTPITLADGTAVPISSLVPGVTLRAFRPDGTIVSAVVRSVLARQVDDYLVVSTERTVLSVTPEHPFYVGHGTYRTPAVLQPGDMVYVGSADGLRPERILSLALVHARVTVYNLQTDEPHTFFASGIAVHNKGGGGGCFPAGTMVQTPTGERRIETLTPGETVLAVDPTGVAVETRIEGLYATTSPLLTVVTDIGTLATTSEHPVALVCGGFCAARQLIAGDRILAWRGGITQTATVRKLRAGTEDTTVFNLQVGSPHTFVADGFVVHNKGGGGFGGGGHGGSGGSVDDYVFWIIVGIFITYYLIRWAVTKADKKEQNLDFNYKPSQVAAKAGMTGKLLEFLAKQDPTMAPNKLTETARSTFLKLQSCWQDRKYEPMQPLMMPDLYADHCRQIAGMIQDHEINLIAELSVKRIDLVNVRYTNDPAKREFTALITARARDYYVDDRTQEYQRGDLAAATFQEFWTFHFHGGAWLLREIEQTRESSVLKDENFFEQFTDDQLQQVYGGKPVDQGGPTGPWLDKETADKGTRIERLLNFLGETDKLWNRTAMLERARDVFTRVYLARQAGKLSAEDAAELFPDVAQDLQVELNQKQLQGISLEFRNLCVRKVDLILIRNHDTRQNSEDEWVARISAHAQKIVRRHGQITQQDEDVTPFEEYWTFGRLDGQWKLKEIVPPARGRQLVAQENLDQDSSPGQLQWFYTKKRTV